MAKHYDTPIDRLAEDLANTGEYDGFDELEPKLIAQFGPTAIKLFRQKREARRYINELCKTARADNE